ncbi:MAG: hypothetical protein HOD91_02850 [Candidatus Marinimicrobia bacterium]|jgi:hypothetical protein|nr:hypothetical protein [Candidatus Neomarinimicrobiota bacterium]
MGLNKLFNKIGFLFLPLSLFAGELSRPEFKAVKTNESIRIDGQLDEAIWSSKDLITGFTQKQPNSGQPATEKTEVRIFYDDEFIYVGARMYETDPEKIAAQMFRRDGDGYSDWFEIILDSYYDLRTAYGFQINPRGVLKDQLYYNDGNEDPTWNAVWSGASVIDNDGWTAELKIPFSQLRYNGKNEEKTWGLQFWRSIARNGEQLFWSPILEESQGFVSQFGTLYGIKTALQPKRLEIQPYSAGKVLRQDGNTDDPYYQLNDPSANMGLDFKYGLGSNFTLTGTINPDFGQVEADPAVINLSAYETFFQERRPFFLEGVDIFDFGSSPMNIDIGPSSSIFYSRRIGRRPQGRVTDSEALYTDYPENTTILAAGKLSGKTSSGWSIGIMDAITTEEKATYTTSQGKEKTEAVEPQANSLVTRVKKDFRGGKSNVGFLFTANNRNLNSDQFKNLLNKNAYVGGIDFSHRLKNEDWILNGYVTGSRISGNEKVITNAQRSPIRYFQRPDADHLSVDSTATSLSGIAYKLELTKFAGKHVRASISINEDSPGYEVNDLGYQQNAGYRGISSFLMYMENTPGKRIRNWNLYSGTWYYSSVDNEPGNKGLFFGSNVTMNNFWNINTGGNISPRGINYGLTRGGPIAAVPASWSLRGNIGTDRRKKIILRVRSNYREDTSNEFDKSYGLNLTVKPFSNISFSVNGNYSKERDTDQYVIKISDKFNTKTFGNRYILADIESERQSISMNVDWTFTPDLTLQFFVSPFVMAYDFTDFKELRKAGTFDFDYYGKDIGTLTLDQNGNSTIDPDGVGPAESFTIGNRDFSFQSVRLNAVLRWEYRPGSTLFFVWQQQRDNYVPRDGELNIGDDYRTLFENKPVNTFVIKASYWLGY